MQTLVTIQQIASRCVLPAGTTPVALAIAKDNDGQFAGSQGGGDMEGGDEGSAENMEDEFHDDNKKLLQMGPPVYVIYGTDECRHGNISAFDNGDWHWFIYTVRTYVWREPYTTPM